MNLTNKVRLALKKIDDTCFKNSHRIFRNKKYLGTFNLLEVLEECLSDNNQYRHLCNLKHYYHRAWSSRLYKVDSGYCRVYPQGTFLPLYCCNIYAELEKLFDQISVISGEPLCGGIYIYKCWNCRCLETSIDTIKNLCL
jgi:hypothetical protein